MLQVACTTEEQVVINAVPRTAQGNPAAVDGALRVTVLEGEGTALQAPETPLQFKARSGDNPGVTRYRVEIDADLGAGEVLISDEVELTVGSATAANLGLSAGVVEPK